MPKECAQCGCEMDAGTSHARRQKYCNRACAAKAYRTRLLGEGNPNFRNAAKKVCKACGVNFENYIKTRKYCSWRCYQRSGAAAANSKRNGALSGGGFTDHNQAEIVSALRDLGVSILITSRVGRGFPDLICGYRGRNCLLEIKNPQTAYGRKGAAPNQQQWADEWQGEKPIVVYSLPEAIGAVCGVSEGLAALDFKTDALKEISQ